MSGIAIYEMNDFFFFNDTATTEIYTLSLHDALPILTGLAAGYNFKIRTVTRGYRIRAYPNGAQRRLLHRRSEEHTSELQSQSNIVCRLLLEKKINGVVHAWSGGNDPQNFQRLVLPQR